ncbi:MAG: type 2 periplasmic-binding domain-containing protein [Candidatus Methylomirabilia bacterium]
MPERSRREVLRALTLAGVWAGTAPLVAGLIGERTALDLMVDFTILGRAAHNRQVWATGGRSRLRTLDDVLERCKTGPVVFAVDEVTTPSFAGAVLAASLLGLDIAFVSGFAGSRESTLAAVRGDVDLVSVNFDSIRDRIESGDLRPLLQISAAPIAQHPSLAGVPLLGGEAGLAASRSGGNAREAAADAADVEGILAPGRLIVAPRGLPAAVFACLEQGLHAAASDPEFVKVASKAERDVSSARAGDTVAELRGVGQHAARFLPIIRRAVEKARR